MPLYENEKNIGYLKLGQISDNKNNNTLIEKISYWQEKYSFDTETLNTSIQNITYKSTEEIYAAAKIMEACTCYIAFKELIEPEESRVFKAAKAYIDKNLSADLDIADICKELSLVRTKLYDIFKREANTGVSEYITRRRMHRAKFLLKTTDMSIPEIASGWDLTIITISAAYIKSVMVRRLSFTGKNSRDSAGISAAYRRRIKSVNLPLRQCVMPLFQAF